MPDTLEILFGPVRPAAGHKVVARVRRADGQWLDPADPAASTWVGHRTTEGWACAPQGGPAGPDADPQASDLADVHALVLPVAGWPDGTRVLVRFAVTSDIDPRGEREGSQLGWDLAEVYREAPAPRTPQVKVVNRVVVNR